MIIFRYLEFITEKFKGGEVTMCQLAHWIKTDAFVKVPISALKEMIETWNIVYKSPASNSFYNKDKSWSHTHRDTIRISDHWNFKAEGHRIQKDIIDDHIHAVTDTPTKEGEWYAGMYSPETKSYKIIKHFEGNSKDDYIKFKRSDYMEKLYKSEPGLAHVHKDPAMIQNKKKIGEFLFSKTKEGKLKVIINGVEYPVCKLGSLDLKYFDGDDKKKIDWSKDPNISFNIDGNEIGALDLKKQIKYGNLEIMN